MRPQVGQVINNKYRLLRLVGDGGMGSVYEARHEVLGTSVALKFLHAELSKRSGLVQRFLQEARVSAQIQSPHVVRVTDVDQTDSGAFIVMEYIEGKTLQTHYEELYKAGIQLSYPDALEYSMQMLEGVEAAHRTGIVHRDLKPDNVMIASDAKGRPLIKLLDFGIAKLKVSGEIDRALTRPGVIMGTPEYMAPEQAFSADAVDARADIFSLGVIIFEMLAGRRPVGGDDPHQIAGAYLSGQIAALTDLAPGIDAGLAVAVHRAMAPVAKDRWATIAELRDAMEPFAVAAKAPSVMSSASLSRVSLTSGGLSGHGHAVRMGETKLAAEAGGRSPTAAHRPETPTPPPRSRLLPPTRPPNPRPRPGGWGRPQTPGPPVHDGGDPQTPRPGVPMAAASFAGPAGRPARRAQDASSRGRGAACACQRRPPRPRPRRHLARRAAAHERRGLDRAGVAVRPGGGLLRRHAVPQRDGPPQIFRRPRPVGFPGAGFRAVPPAVGSQQGKRAAQVGLAQLAAGHPAPRGRRLRGGGGRRVPRPPPVQDRRSRGSAHRHRAQRHGGRRSAAPRRRPRPHRWRPPWRTRRTRRCPLKPPGPKGSAAPVTPPPHSATPVTPQPPRSAARDPFPPILIIPSSLPFDFPFGPAPSRPPPGEQPSPAAGPPAAPRGEAARRPRAR